MGFLDNMADEIKRKGESLVEDHDRAYAKSERMSDDQLIRAYRNARKVGEKKGYLDAMYERGLAK